ncbi:hypothetical protein N399_08760 [Bacillus licheniformis CG-B52]|nr:hypothetical protein [Bacillus paralicheniformis]AKQ72681.1 hypothetical protein MUY_001549 [Bacillus licheniformis WX-02]EQM28419.1 hypothetical protein N399_08760 [Bacillus licheniformis CG-B52]MBU8759297.1 hypothetical protein [Bacillus paralicheniformis]
MIDTVMKLSAIIATWLGILKIVLEIRKMRKESESKERRPPTKKHRRRT